jgi:catechol 2,3-dioxygenase-like lactoylglutathione lyase family enzyme
VPVAGFDHVALPTSRPEELIAFYGALGFSVPDVAEWRRSGRPFFAIRFGRQKINVHAPALWQKPDFTLRGPAARPGCADLCFVWEGGLDALRATLARAGAEIVAGPVELEGARGNGTSLYTRDPDSNLLEFIVYDA